MSHTSSGQGWLGENKVRVCHDHLPGSLFYVYLIIHDHSIAYISYLSAYFICYKCPQKHAAPPPDLPTGGPKKHTMDPKTHTVMRKRCTDQPGKNSWSVHLCIFHYVFHAPMPEMALRSSEFRTPVISDRGFQQAEICICWGYHDKLQHRQKRKK